MYIINNKYFFLVDAKSNSYQNLLVVEIRQRVIDELECVRQREIKFLTLHSQDEYSPKGKVRKIDAA
ncbi:MAG TPA: hypothetical protein DD649_11930 [Providencia sp.]|nr:hypothetical protein [Providencia sp.]